MCKCVGCGAPLGHSRMVHYVATDVELGHFRHPKCVGCEAPLGHFRFLECVVTGSEFGHFRILEYLG
jgi:hypothetical protein